MVVAIRSHELGALGPGGQRIGRFAARPCLGTPEPGPQLTRSESSRGAPPDRPQKLTEVPATFEIITLRMPEELTDCSTNFANFAAISSTPIGAGGAAGRAPDIETPGLVAAMGGGGIKAACTCCLGGSPGRRFPAPAGLEASAVDADAADAPLGELTSYIKRVHGQTHPARPALELCLPAASLSAVRPL